MTTLHLYTGELSAGHILMLCDRVIPVWYLGTGFGVRIAQSKVSGSAIDSLLVVNIHHSETITMALLQGTLIPVEWNHLTSSVQHMLDKLGYVE